MKFPDLSNIEENVNSNLKNDEDLEKTHKSDSNVSYDDYEENLSEEEFNLNNEQIEPELTPNNIQTHIDHLNSYEFLLSSNNQKSNFICHYIDIIKDVNNFIENIFTFDKAKEIIILNNKNYIEIESISEEIFTTKKEIKDFDKNKTDKINKYIINKRHRRE